MVTKPRSVTTDDTIEVLLVSLEETQSAGQTIKVMLNIFPHFISHLNLSAIVL